MAQPKITAIKVAPQKPFAVKPVAPAGGPALNFKVDPTTGMPVGTDQKTFAIGAYNPDYSKMLTNDPSLVQGLANMRADSNAEQSHNQEQINRAMINLGMTPDGVNVDPTTAALAQEQTNQGLSTVAQIAHQHQLAMQGIDQLSSANGNFHSGSTGVSIGNEDVRNKGAYNDALGSFNDYLYGLKAAQVQHEGTRETDAANMKYDAAQNQMRINPATPGTPMQTSLIPKLGVYKGVDGRVYGQDGSALSNSQIRSMRTPYAQGVSSLRAQGQNWNQIKKTPQYSNFMLINQALGLNPNQ